MAKTDFSSSSPLAGSFLTGHIHPVPPQCAVAAVRSVSIYFCNNGESRLCGCFTLHGGFFSSAIFALIDAYDNEAVMS